MTGNEHLYKRYLKHGLAGFEDPEVIEFLLSLRLDKQNHRVQANNLYNKYGSLTEIINACYQERCIISEIPDKHYLGLKLPHEIANRYLFEKTKTKPFIRCSEDILNYLQHSMRGLKTEHFKVIYLNGRNMVLADDVHSNGTLTTSAVYPREVIKSALRHDAAALVFAHNHPSGNPYPSRDDIRITKRLKDAASLLEIQVHDHIIIAGNEYYSFADKGLI